MGFSLRRGSVELDTLYEGLEISAAQARRETDLRKDGRVAVSAVHGGFGRDLLLEALAGPPVDSAPPLAVDLAVLRNFLQAAATADVAFYSGEELQALQRVEAMVRSAALAAREADARVAAAEAAQWKAEAQLSK